MNVYMHVDVQVQIDTHYKSFSRRHFRIVYAPGLRTFVLQPLCKNAVVLNGFRLGVGGEGLLPQMSTIRCGNLAFYAAYPEAAPDPPVAAPAPAPAH